MNVLSYFLIVLGGFGVVWGFRWFKYLGVEKKPISDFEYAAFSAIWGSSLFILFAKLLEGRNDLWTVIDQYPFVATPSLFVLGTVIGGFSAYVVSQICYFVKRFL